MSVLKVKNLTKTFSSGFWPFSAKKIFTAVDNVSFELEHGTILGLLGSNGAGKTTIIQMLLGTLLPSSGEIKYFGKDFAQNQIASLKKIGYASGYDRLPARLTVKENLDIVARIYGIQEPSRSERIEKLLTAFGIKELYNNLTGTLSAGQATRVMLAKAFLANPEIVLLDEPTASLDPEVARDVRQFILTEQKERNVSVLITSHNMDEVSELCDRVLVLKHGVIIADNTPEALAKSIAKAHAHLIITSDINELITFLNNSKIDFKAEENQFTIELDEHAIAKFLSDLAERKIFYSQISIDKPTLEDYFLSIAK